VEFELLFESKFEQKDGTSLVKLVLLHRKSGLLQSVCPSQLYIFDIAQVPLGPRWECIESNLHGYQFFQYKLISRNIDICTVNKDKKFWLNLVIWGRFYDVIHGWQADF
jgi:hypothetical protein